MSKWVVHIPNPYGADDGCWVLVEAKDAAAAKQLVTGAGTMLATSVEPYDAKVHKLTRR